MIRFGCFSHPFPSSFFLELGLAIDAVCRALTARRDATKARIAPTNLDGCSCSMLLKILMELMRVCCCVPIRRSVGERTACCAFSICSVSVHDRINNQTSCPAGEQVHAECF